MGDMIDRDAALAIVERGEFVYQNIAALPVRCHYEAGNPRCEPVTQPAPDAAMRLETVSENIARDMREGRFPARSEPQMVPVEPAPDPVCTDCGGTGITYQTERRCACQPAPHVNETPKSEHDAGNVLTAGAIREDSPNHAYRVGYAAGRAAALREAAATVQAGDTVQSIQRRILALLTEKPHDRA